MTTDIKTLEQRVIRVILQEDLFKQHGVASYEIIEFEPNRTGPEYAWFLKL